MPSKRRIQSKKNPQENIDKPQNVSASRKKIECEYSNSNGKTSLDAETEIATPENWIISTDNLLSLLKKLCVCRIYYDEITMWEPTNYRAGLRTKFTLKCVNEDCSQKETFYTTKKNKYSK